jgi:hypothetical protein
VAEKATGDPTVPGLGVAVGCPTLTRHLPPAFVLSSNAAVFCTMVPVEYPRASARMSYGPTASADVFHAQVALALQSHKVFHAPGVVPPVLQLVR